MKALYLCSNKTGLQKSRKQKEFVFNSLRNIYKDIKIIETENIEDFEENIRESVGFFDIVIVGGGDGSLKVAVNVLMEFPKDKRPVLGYLPLGTINDAGKGFGVKGSVRQALKVLKQNNVVEIDVCKFNDEYFNFVCAAGAFSNISYSTKREPKKRFGRIAYYFAAIPSFFEKKLLDIHVVADGKVYDVKTPVVLIMNSRNLGGFRVNYGYALNDGLVEMYLTKPGICNGFFHFLFFKVRTLKIRASSLEVSMKSNEFWCLDGDQGPQGNAKIVVLKQELRVVGKLN